MFDKTFTDTIVLTHFSHIDIYDNCDTTYMVYICSIYVGFNMHDDSSLFEFNCAFYIY